MKIILFLFSTAIATQIHNKYSLVCKNCKYFKPDPTYSFDSITNSKCMCFGDKSIITGDIEYDNVEKCRNDETKCGKEGIQYVEEKNIVVKKLWHNTKMYGVLFTPFYFVIFFQCIVYILLK